MDISKNKDFTRFLITNFISSFIIAAVGCYLLIKIGLYDVLYIGNIFGIYFLIIYGVNVLVEEGYIENKRRTLLAAAYILIFDAVFISVIPLLFGFDFYKTTDIINLTLNGVNVNLIFNPIVYLAIFALVILIFNYMLLRLERNNH